MQVQFYAGIDINSRHCFLAEHNKNNSACSIKQQVYNGGRKKYICHNGRSYFYGENDIKTFIVEVFIKIINNKYNSNILITEKTLLRKLKRKFIISDYITNEQILKINFDI